ncbi:hypothetical protein DFQ28_004950 [Apophysomyces sp. BC1034]|nr:hypothetical protein DFQ28_004950 [Apophysomyces sp. BC1034]
MGPMPRRRRPPKEDQNILLESYAKDQPSIPPYLQGTNYARLVNEQYKLYLVRYPSKRGSENPEIASDEDHPNYGSILENLDLRLPTAWSQKDRDEFIDMDTSGLQLTYKGKYFHRNKVVSFILPPPPPLRSLGEDDSDMATVRANFPMRPQCGIFYFEVEVLSQGCDIGFCWSSHVLGQQPGTGREERAWGYHASDGHIYFGSNASKSYGPTFGTGDVIGCGVDFRDMTAFYTKNGVHLGTAFHNIKGRMIFPAVGFETPGDRTHTNFGESDFLFDISQYLKDEKARSFQDICGQTLHSSPTSPSTLHICESRGEDQAKPITAEIVKEYLQHYGFVNTYEAFKRDSTPSIPLDTEMEDVATENENDMRRRREIMDAVRRVDVDNVIRLFDLHYPNVAQQVQHILFGLRCRKFVELVWRAGKGAKTKSARQTSKISGEAAPMDVDEIEVETTPQAGDKRRRSILESGQESPDTDSDDDAYATEGMREAMEYGRELTRLYNEIELKESMTARLKEAFSVLAYKFPGDCPPGFYNDPSWVDSMADALNTNIVCENGRHYTSILERIYCQTEAAVTELECYGNGKAAMVEPRQNFLP